MAKLTGAKKKAFLERMAKGRKKAAKTSPRKKAAKKNPRKKAAKKNPRKKAAKKTRTVKNQVRSPKRKARKAKKAKANKTPKRTNPRGRRRRNSTDAEAAAMFEQFHQRAPGKILEYDEIVRFPDRFAELGKLVELRVFLDRDNPDFPFVRFGDCKAVATPDGANIYFAGGDQAIDLEALGMTSDKDTVELGPCTFISYYTVKGFHDFQPTTYEHDFGEEDGVFPRLGYDRLNKRLYLIGGNYQVKREGIVN